MYLFNLQNVYVQFARCICSICKMYLFNLIERDFKDIQCCLIKPGAGRSKVKIAKEVVFLWRCTRRIPRSLDNWLNIRCGEKSKMLETQIFTRTSQTQGWAPDKLYQLSCAGLSLLSGAFQLHWHYRRNQLCYCVIWLNEKMKSWECATTRNNNYNTSERARVPTKCPRCCD